MKSGIFRERCVSKMTLDLVNFYICCFYLFTTFYNNVYKIKNRKDENRKRQGLRIPEYFLN